MALRNKLNGVLGFYIKTIEHPGGARRGDLRQGGAWAMRAARKGAMMASLWASYSRGAISWRGAGAKTCTKAQRSTRRHPKLLRHVPNEMFQIMGNHFDVLAKIKPRQCP